MAFYRIYRPQVIDEIDNAHVREQLLSLLRKERKQLPHAFLFSGSKGTGKTTAARVVAKIFNCTKMSKVTGPCGKCEQCATIALGTNIDILEIDAASNRGIDEMRTLRERIGLSPSAASFKVYIIDEVHMLTTEAFNALLKTLEEPPAHAVFVLATTDPQKVPATIVSRCIHIAFSRASKEELAHALGRIVKKEKMKIDKDAIARISDLADGSFRDGVKILEQASLHRGLITPAVVEKFAAAPTSRKTSDLVSAVFAGNTKDALFIVEEFVSEGGDVRAFLLQCLSFLHGALLAGLQEKKDGSSLARTKSAIELFTKAYADMRISPIAQLPLELAIVELTGGEEEGRDEAVAVKKEKEAPSPQKVIEQEEEVGDDSLGLLTLEKLTEHWLDFIAATKPFNHSVSGVLRSSRPTSVSRGIVTITAFYPFHKEKLSEVKTREVLASVLKKLFGENVKVEIELGKK
jgi:DNA polymerase-3 subunit gamma/tau